MKCGIQGGILRLHNAMRPWTYGVGLLCLLSGCGGGGGGGGGGGAEPEQPPASTFSIGGSAHGIAGPGLVLLLNETSELALDVDRAFAFAQTLGSGASYRVSVKRNPVGQNCSVSNATGVVTANVDNVLVTCETPVPDGSGSFQIGGTISGLVGSGLTLSNGADTVTVPAGNTSFAFAQRLASGTAYEVSISTQPVDPVQNCVVSNYAGTVSNADVTHIAVACVTPPAPASQGLILSRSTLSFEGEEGQTVADQVVTGSIVAATGPVFVSVRSSSVGLQWVNYRWLGDTSGQLTVSPRPSGTLTPGVYVDAITVTACYDENCTRPVAGSPKQLPVSYTVRAPAPAPILRLSDHGVAFASVPGASQLVRELTVGDSSGAATGWRASSSAAWLSVTPSGNSGGTLRLAANPSGLADGLYLASVAIASDNPAITRTETVRVGLYVSAATSASRLAVPPPSPPAAIVDSVMEADPVRPLVYSSAGATIAVDHVHTGQRVATLNVAGAELGTMTVSDDGSRLYVLNYADCSMVVVDLDTMTVLRRYGFPQLLMWPSTLQDSRIAFARVHGQPALVLTNASMPYGVTSRSLAAVLKADSGELVGELYGQYGIQGLRMAVSRDGSTLYAANAGLSGMLSTQRIELRANSAGNLYGKVVASTPGVNRASLQDIATNSDGSRVWVAYATDDRVLEAVYSGGALQWTAGLAPFQRPAGSDSRFSLPVDLQSDAWGRLATHDSGRELRIYDAGGTIRQQWLDLQDPLVWGPSGSMRISGDGLRLIGNGRLMSIQP